MGRPSSIIEKRQLTRSRTSLHSVPWCCFSTHKHLSFIFWVPSKFISVLSRASLLQSFWQFSHPLKNDQIIGKIIFFEMSLHLEDTQLLAIKPLTILILSQSILCGLSWVRHILIEDITFDEADQSVGRVLFQEVQREQHRLQDLSEIQWAVFGATSE